MRVRGMPRAAALHPPPRAAEMKKKERKKKNGTANGNTTHTLSSITGWFGGQTMANSPRVSLLCAMVHVATARRRRAMPTLLPHSRHYYVNGHQQLPHDDATATAGWRLGRDLAGLHAQLLRPGGCVHLMRHRVALVLVFEGVLLVVLGGSERERERERERREVGKEQGLLPGPVSTNNSCSQTHQ